MWHLRLASSRFCLGIGATLTALALCAAVPSASAQQLKKVTVALGGDGLQISTVHIANGAGFFKEEGIEIDFVDANSGPRQIAAVLGGSALWGPIGFAQVLKSQDQGGTLIATANLLSVLDTHIVLSTEAIRKSGIEPGMTIDEKVKRMKGLRIGITSPGSTTDAAVRALFKSRGIDPDNYITIQPLGGGTNMLAALEKGATDGFGWSAPQPQIAELRGIGKVILNPLRGEVPEMIDVPYEIMEVNAATMNTPENADLIKRSIRAMTKGMKFAHANPDKALEIVQARFPNFDKDVLKAAWPAYLKGIPETPVLTEKLFDNTLKWINITSQPPLTVKFDKVVTNDLAREIAKEVLGK